MQVQAGRGERMKVQYGALNYGVGVPPAVVVAAAAAWAAAAAAKGPRSIGSHLDLGEHAG